MTKKDRIKKLLDTINSLEAKRGVEGVDESLNDLTTRLINEESARVASQLSNNSVVKLLARLSSEMSKIKKGFDLQPVLNSIKEIADDSSLRDETRKSIRSLEDSIKEVRKISESTLQFPNQLKDAEYKLSKNFDEAISKIRQEIPKEFNNSENLKKFAELDEKIDFAKRELQMSFSRGGSANLQINVNSSVMSKKYTDINFVSDTAVRWIATDDNNNKRVNIRASIISSGSGGAAGNPAGNNTEVQFNDNGSFGASTTFTWNKNTNTLTAPTVVSSTIQLNSQGLIDFGEGGQAISLNAGVLSFTGSVAAQAIELTANDAIGTAILNVANLTDTRTFSFPDLNGDFAISGANQSVSFGSVLTGQQGSVAGRVNIAGNTTGTVAIQSASVAGNWILTLPSNDGSANQVLTTDGNGITTWASVAATGGSGITRSINVVTTDTTAADSASTDYVYFVNAGIRLTLPTAVANTNLYTVKNTSSSSVLVLAPEGIDGSASALMPTNFESLSFISNSSIWGVV